MFSFVLRQTTKHIRNPLNALTFPPDKENKANIFPEGCNQAKQCNIKGNFLHECDGK